MSAILGWGGYVPRLRLARESILEAHGWVDGALASGAKGRRSFADWDEDALTMAVAAARAAIADAGNAEIDGIALGSATAPFAERHTSALLAAALGIAAKTRDLSGGARAGFAAIATASDAAAAASGDWLAVASEMPVARPGTAREMAGGDGAAAFVLGAATDPHARAEIIGQFSCPLPSAERQRASGDPFGQDWEARWRRDVIWSEAVPLALGEALNAFDLAPSDVAALILPTPDLRASAAVAKSCGVAAGAVAAFPADGLGDCDGATAPLMLIAALEAAAPGDRIVVVSVGQGVDVLGIEAGDGIRMEREAPTLAAMLAWGVDEQNYHKFLRFRDLIPAEKGLRAAQVPPSPAPVLHRRAEMLGALEGGLCSTCGTLQFPRSRICVSPQCRAKDTQKPYGFAHRNAKIISFSEDYLAPSPSPPSLYGMVEFEGGGRIMMDFAECRPGDVATGDVMRPAFRLRDRDASGAGRYFWKAVPIRQEGEG